MAAAIAKADASALPLARNTAFPINVKILACSASRPLRLLPLVLAAQCSHTKPARTRRYSAVRAPSKAWIAAIPWPGAAQLGAVSPNMLSWRQCHCDKLDKLRATPIESFGLSKKHHAART